MKKSALLFLLFAVFSCASVIADAVTVDVSMTNFSFQPKTVPHGRRLLARLFKRRPSMNGKTTCLTAVFAASLLLFTACASQQPLVTIGQAKGEVVLAMSASNFAFEPNNIRAYRGDVIVLKIKNASGTEHNFTMKDPKDNTVENVALPSGETVTVRIPLAEVGTYRFYCDKPFHSGFGMKGRIEVNTEP